MVRCMPISAGVPSNQVLLCEDMIDTLQQLGINGLHCLGRYAQLQHQPNGVPAAETLARTQAAREARPLPGCCVLTQSPSV